MSLDLEIQALLRSPQVREINFTMRGIRVTGAGFAELATHFSDQTIPQRIRVTVRPELVPPGDDAVYESLEDKINLRSDTVLSSPVGRSVVVHECTHAQLDFRGRTTSVRSEEGAGFIAETWYLLASGMTDAETGLINGSDIRNIAANLRSQAQNTGGIVEVSAEQINTVRRVMASFGYAMSRGRPYVQSGIGGHIYRGE